MSSLRSGLDRCRALRALALIATLSACPSDPEPATWSTAFDAESLGWLLNVGGPAPDDLYAVGGSPEGDGVMMHFDGSTWSPVTLPGGTPLLNWVHAFGPNDIFSVGNGGTVIRYDGTSWTTIDSGVDRNLWGVWGASPDDVWAVGGNGMEDGQATIIRFDGSTWSPVTMPTLERPRVFAWFKVWGTSASDVWIVGQRGAVVHWDGSALTEHLVGADQDLISLWGTGPDNVVAIGGRGNGIVAAWDGTSWRSESLAPLLGLNGIWMRDDGKAHVVGLRGTTAILDVATFDYEEIYADTMLDLHAIYAVGGSPLVAVGGSLASPAAPYRGVAVTRPLREGE
jgi:hypothetical protein